MTNRTAAIRYARALLDIAVKERRDLQEIEAQLAQFVDLFTQHPMLQKVMLNPAVPVSRKRAAIAQLTMSAKVTPVLAKLIGLLADRDRLVLLPDLLAAYRERMLDHLQVVRAAVTTAVKLPAERAAAVERSLARLTGRKVTLETQVDPAIIGGVIARIGSTIYDGSVTTRLRRMKERLLGGSEYAR